MTVSSGGSSQASSGFGPGSIIDGKYEVLALLGVGGMGEVFQARHLHLGALRCIKVMRATLMKDESYRNRFLREARLATQIHHPNVAVVHDFSVLEDGTTYMVTEYIDGTTLRQWSASHGRFPLALAAEVAIQVLAGIGHIHRRGLLHRDMSSDNIMLSFDADDRMVAKIIDLGIAKDVSNTVNADTTQMGMIVGNPKYMSPEQLGELAEGEHLDARADLYSFGVVLYEMLMGVPPFVSRTPHGYILKHLTETPRSFHDIDSHFDFPPLLEAAIFRALAKDRKKRFADARDFSAALRPFLREGGGDLSKETVLELHRADSRAGDTEDDTPTSEVTAPTLDPEMRAWQKALVADDIKTYREFLAAYPKTRVVVEAKQRIDELTRLGDIVTLEKNGDATTLQKIVAENSSSRVVSAAHEALLRLDQRKEGERREKTAFEAAWENGSSEAWRAFLTSYPNGKLRTRADDHLTEASAYEEALQDETGEELRQFLNCYPEGRHHLDAEISLSSAKNREAERAFTAALQADSYNAMRQFIARFPLFPRAAEATRILEERLAFETATAMDSEDAWESYLTSWGESAHASAARERLESARKKEVDAFDAAFNEGTAVAWQAFIEEFPHGRRTAKAEQRRREAMAFERAQQRGSTGLKEFLEHYPDGPHAREARRLRSRFEEKEDFTDALALDDPRIWSRYLERHPAGAHATDARERLQQLEDDAYQRLLESQDPDAAEEFLDCFPESLRGSEVERMRGRWDETRAVREALAAIERDDEDAAFAWCVRISDDDRRAEVEASITLLRDRLDWREADRKKSAAAMRNYLAAHPDGRWVEEAQQRLEGLESSQEEREPEEWDSAWEAGSVEAWDRYLAEFPRSARLMEGKRCREEAAEFGVAIALNTLILWRAFLKSWPEGRHRIEAELRLRALEGHENRPSVR